MCMDLKVERISHQSLPILTSSAVHRVKPDSIDDYKAAACVICKSLGASVD